MEVPSWLKGFARGVFVEVLWDVERVLSEGRRKGERLTESLWWRAQVVDLRTKDGYLIAKLHYDAKEHFDSQVDEVKVLPFHVQPLSEAEPTELKWRYFESTGFAGSGAPHDQVECTSFHDETGIGVSIGDVADLSAHISLNKRLEELGYRMDRMEKLVSSHRELSTRLLCMEKVTENRCERVFQLLRQNLALFAQKPLTGFKSRTDGSDHSVVFDRSCGDSMSVSVDCNIEDFEFICDAVKSNCRETYFSVDGRRVTPGSGALMSSFNVAEVSFNSLFGLCEGIGITSASDIMTIAQKRTTTTGKNSEEEAAIRVCGSFLADHDSDDMPSAILVGNCLHAGISQGKQVSALWRENRELGDRTVWYQHALQRRDMRVSDLLRSVYKKKLVTAEDRNTRDLITLCAPDNPCFSLRFKPLPNPKLKVWTRTMISRNNFVGTCEVSVPFILLRGAAAVSEYESLVSQESNNDFMSQLL